MAISGVVNVLKLPGAGTAVTVTATAELGTVSQVAVTVGVPPVATYVTVTVWASFPLSALTVTLVTSLEAHVTTRLARKLELASRTTAARIPVPPTCPAKVVGVTVTVATVAGGVTQMIACAAEVTPSQDAVRFAVPAPT
jgi:hypothetical protein